MAHANKKHMGTGTQGKGTGAGALADVFEDQIPPNMVLSNRDKQLHSRTRTLDSKTVQTEQWHEHDTNRLPEE
ncbi:hypothetical protein GCM10007301_55750 [Azorhizobium oxalatiphilum]|uniref:Uncharacterized protein n=1 Tax=Azorhizobium oxalatiphilum TaxID=980631 RepID=A0A917CH19_9HYPH|nr:hypothetical protein [Azorhizobium oxalatiphilum]GGF88649.1 hypothetical protein GCM10007301_55750 [Azorhizobium oxalatiphilum]